MHVHILESYIKQLIIKARQQLMQSVAL